MTNPTLRSSFVIRVFTKDSKELIKLHNLKTTETLEFVDYKDLIEYLQARANPKGLR